VATAVATFGKLGRGNWVIVLIDPSGGWFDCGAAAQALG